MIPPNQRKIYTAIKDFWTNGRTVIDIGCSIGIGTNILSHTARHAWGIDINKDSIAFAKEMFERPNVSFDLMDLEHPTTREYAPFEVVVMSEVIEHLEDVESGLGSVKQFFSNKLNTVGFITVPNVNNEEIQKRDEANPLHINHWTAGEFYELMTKHFQHVVLYSSDKLRNWDLSETVDGASTDQIIIAKVEGVINA